MIQYVKPEGNHIHVRLKTKVLQSQCQVLWFGYLHYITPAQEHRNLDNTCVDIHANSVEWCIITLNIAPTEPVLP